MGHRATAAATVSFRTPRGIAVDSSGNVYVADTYNRYPSIQKFDSNGVILTKWGSEGSGDGRVPVPPGCGRG